MIQNLKPRVYNHFINQNAMNAKFVTFFSNNKFNSTNVTSKKINFVTIYKTAHKEIEIIQPTKPAVQILI